jgi:peptide-methionine (S)-S-oxide reductase
MNRIFIAIIVGCVGMALWSCSGASTNDGPATRPSGDGWAATPAEAGKTEKDMSNIKTETATFAAGCFWGVESTFRKVPGVLKTRVGYTGGKMKNPSYEDVCTDETGHAEAIDIEFDPARVSYQDLLNVFFENHDPTTVDRQGPDVGNQYRSAIFYHSPEQEKAAEAEKDKRDESGDYVGPIATQIVAAGVFYPAEDYHQRYFELRGVNWSCHSGNGKKATAAH